MARTHPFRLRKGDTVEVLTGRDRGRQGVIDRVVPETGHLVVEGINVRKRHTKPRAMGQRAGIIEFNAPLDASNVMLVCQHCGARSRIGIRVSRRGVRTRYCKSCNEPLDE
ncbi:MAG: 50S ribosomal protein L24 [Chloroflexota bacterium]|nr:50S ribosomal protein L24 [Chloroflexota bacterium]